MKFDSEQMVYGSVMMAGLGSGLPGGITPRSSGTLKSDGPGTSLDRDRLIAIAKALIPARIALDLDVHTSKQAFEAAAGWLTHSHGLASAPLVRALLRREDAGSTALGRGIAIPHARVGGIDQPLTIFIRTASPIPFDAPDGKPVSTMLVIFVPETGSTDEHLQLLALVAEMACDVDFRTRLADAADPAAVWHLFAQWVAHKLPGTVDVTQTRHAD